MRPEGYATLLRGNRRFLFFWLSTVSGETGYSVYTITVVWLAVEISGGIGVAGLVLAIEYGVYALSFLIGPFVDRARDLRIIILVGFPLQLVAAAAIGVTLLLHLLTVPLLIGLVVALSVLWNFTYVAQNSMLPRLVAENDLFRANGLVSAAGGVNQVAGFAAGAVLLVVLGPAGGAFLYAALNGLAGLLAIPLSAPQTVGSGRSLRDDFLDGWRQLLSGEGRPGFHLSVFSGLQAFFSSAPSLLIAALASTSFHHSAGSYGLLFTAFGIGSVAGGLVLGGANPRSRLLLVLSGSTVAEGALIALGATIAPALLASAGAWFAIGAVDVLFFTGCLAYFQATTPKGLFGRVWADFYLFRGGSRAAGAVVVGLLAGLLGPVGLGYLVAVGWVLIGVAAPLALPGVRRLRF